MIPFLLIFFSVYGLYHIYFFRKIRSAFTMTAAQTTMLLAALLFLTSAPILVRVLERAGFEDTAYVTALAGFYWMGFIFEFFCLGLFLDLILLLRRLLFKIIKKRALPISSRLFFRAVSFLSLSICLYGSYEASNILRHDLSISTEKFPEHAEDIKIAQISDVHLGLLTGQKKLERIIGLLNEIQPDLIVCTGDLLDGQGDGLPELAALLREVSPRLGKFAVTGNHEFYVGIEKSKRFLREAGFTVLDGRSASPESVITIVGVDDRSNRFSPERPEDETDVLRKSKSGLYTIFLKHRPVVKKESLGLFDLQLSGHTHQGQLFPFNFVTRLYFPVPNGTLLELAKGHLYVNRGTGTWGPPLRILAPPEITVFNLTSTGKTSYKSPE